MEIRIFTLSIFLIICYHALSIGLVIMNKVNDDKPIIIIHIKKESAIMFRNLAASLYKSLTQLTEPDSEPEDLEAPIEKKEEQKATTPTTKPSIAKTVISDSLTISSYDSELSSAIIKQDYKNIDRLLGLDHNFNKNIILNAIILSNIENYSSFNFITLKTLIKEINWNYCVNDPHSYAYGASLVWSVSNRNDQQGYIQFLLENHNILETINWSYLPTISNTLSHFNVAEKFEAVILANNKYLHEFTQLPAHIQTLIIKHLPITSSLRRHVEIMHLAQQEKVTRKLSKETIEEKNTNSLSHYLDAINVNALLSETHYLLADHFKDEPDQAIYYLSKIWENETHYKEAQLELSQLYLYQLYLLITKKENKNQKPPSIIQTTSIFSQTKTSRESKETFSIFKSSKREILLLIINSFKYACIYAKVCSDSSTSLKFDNFYDFKNWSFLLRFSLSLYIRFYKQSPQFISQLKDLNLSPCDFKKTLTHQQNIAITIPDIIDSHLETFIAGPLTECRVWEIKGDDNEIISDFFENIEQTILIKKYRDLKNENDTLKKQISTLENRVKTLEKLLAFEKPLPDAVEPKSSSSSLTSRGFS